ncbi:helix-turn-helix transcriptional regulator [Rhizobium lentis]|uniref:ArsR/SmtB family transcription factor n=1 Tax=Rhizobium TaxID=379 RepID=UPI00161D6327|nr:MULTISPECIES: metalloregulator ArsR/SmtB family transcription factor [Rhizobium]MBB3354126.1 DNA-binding transcriptional ArsR family regulator [Rhizobium sp. BK049]MBX5135581.1 helix-turn-helix transcriptional regulator [Rhizobium lentis]MBX5141517.1 helix-turn-helix transcriptional regulator [Rhizobium lentis]MBX5153676.1 helix-turn-helix transcriptional regulator [Rhizobium lentis]
MIDNRNTARQSALLTAICNESRLKILSVLLGDEVTAGNLATVVGLSQSATSQHLAKLRHLKLVTVRREAQTLWYSTDNVAVIKILALLEELGRAGHPLPKAKAA